MNLDLELAMLRAMDPGVVIPGIDTETGIVEPESGWIGLDQLSTSIFAKIQYRPSTNSISVVGDNLVIENYDFGNVTVYVYGDNVTFKNCKFTNTTGYASLIQTANATGAVVENCTFDTTEAVGSATYIASLNYITITNNSFLNINNDAIDLRSGVVTGNYITGIGLATIAAHCDGIWVSNTNGPVLIENNYINIAANPDSPAGANNCVRITNELGGVSDVTVRNNILLGGSTGIDAGNGVNYAGRTGTYSNIEISDNYLGFARYGSFYLGQQLGVTSTNNVTIDYTNPIYSQRAWTDYVAQGIQTNVLITATTASNVATAAATGASTVYGDDIVGVHLTATKALETIFIGGASTQFYWGGAGLNIYSYLSPSDSTVTGSDAIGNFAVAKDVIDFHAIDANPLTTEHDSFTFIGSAAFSSAGGEVRVVQDTARNLTLIDVDLVGDNSADMEIRLAGLLDLTADNFALTAAQFAAVTAPFTTMASFATSQAELDLISGGFSIVDSAANVLANLGGLAADAANIDAVTLTDVSATAPALISLSASDAAADAAILADIVSPYVLRTVQSDGTTDVQGSGNGLTIKIGAGDHLVTGGGNNEIFYLESNFGSVTITDFSNKYADTTRDRIQLSTADFANWAQLVASGHASGANNEDTTFTSATTGSTLTVTGVAFSKFQTTDLQLYRDFSFHA
jgi:hypothetical protein